MALIVWFSNKLIFNEIVFLIYALRIYDIPDRTTISIVPTFTTNTYTGLKHAMEVSKSVPLSLAYPDGHLRQSNQSNLRNVIIKDSTESLSEYPARGAVWIYDGMALYRRFKPENTYREWLAKVIRDAMALPLENESIAVHIVNDQYWRSSTKNDTRLARGDGEISRRVHVKSVDEKMLKGKDWNDCFIMVRTKKT